MIKYYSGTWKSGRPEKLDVDPCFYGFYLNLNPKCINGSDEYLQEETLFNTEEEATKEVKRLLLKALEDNSKARARYLAALSISS